jgi:hypothetical protein
MAQGATHTPLRKKSIVPHSLLGFLAGLKEAVNLAISWISIETDAMLVKAVVEEDFLKKKKWRGMNTT